MTNTEYFLSLIKPNSYSELLDLLLTQKIINKKNILRYCIKSDYYMLLKKEQRKNCFDIKIDLANKYDVSLDFVCHTIYRNKNLKI